jgi:hypothetical protein
VVSAVIGGVDLVLAELVPIRFMLSLLVPVIIHSTLPPVFQVSVAVLPFRTREGVTVNDGAENEGTEVDTSYTRAVLHITLFTSELSVTDACLSAIIHTWYLPGSVGSKLPVMLRDWPAV